MFSFQTLGVMSDAAEDIATGAEVCIVENMLKFPHHSGFASSPNKALDHGISLPCHGILGASDLIVEAVIGL